MKEATETWFVYFDYVTTNDWRRVGRVGVERALVKCLLANGAHEFSNSIHEIPAKEALRACHWVLCGVHGRTYFIWPSKDGSLMRSPERSFNMH